MAISMDCSSGPLIETNRSSGPTPRLSSRVSGRASSRRTSPRWEAGNRLDKRLGLPHDQALAAAANDKVPSAKVSSGNPLSRRTSPRWEGGNREDKKRGTLAASGSQAVLGTNSSLRASVHERRIGGGLGLRVALLRPSALRGVQSTSRSDAIRIFIGVDPKDATVKHAEDPLAWYAPNLSMVAPNKAVWLDQNEAAAKNIGPALT